MNGVNGTNGMNGTNEGVLEISNIPPINLGERLQYLLRYPHGCIEQTTSSGFPQLYVSKLLELDENPPIIENGDSENHHGLEENIQTDNGCPEANSGLEEIHKRTSTAAQNESIGLVENPNNLENVLNVDGRVSDRCCVMNIPHTTLFPDKKVNNICYDMSQTNFIMKKDSDEFQKLMKEWEKMTAGSSFAESARFAAEQGLLDYFPVAEMLWRQPTMQTESDGFNLNYNLVF